MFQSLTHEEFLERLRTKGILCKPLEQYKGSTEKILFECDKNSEHTFMASPDSIYSNKNRTYCPYCNRRKVFVGETDMWTTNPEMAKMLLDPEDGYKYLDTSSYRVNWVCQNCGNVMCKVINDVRLNGLSCERCSDNRSLGEKIVASILDQLKVDYIYNRSTEWSGSKRYDFIIPSHNMIIEVQGAQHYYDSFVFKNGSKRTFKEEVINDEYKKNLAIENGIKHYIYVNCIRCNLVFIKNSILESDLAKCFDLSKIDWNVCYRDCNRTNMEKVISLWNDGIDSTKRISDITGIHISSVISYLKQGTSLGLCNYIKGKHKSDNTRKAVRCIETNKVYPSILSVRQDGYCNSRVGMCCNGRIETAHGLHWEFFY